MAHWIITYQKDNNTSKLDIEAASKPDMEDANRQLLAWAEGNLPAGEFAECEDPSHEPAIQLLKRYGITLTGIARG
ncbi:MULTISPECIES: hypothetical protein [Pseudomonas]|uniref:hypothetical protein n=1 Tax=Pseudomonas TaxID=286 RepID=UPI000DA9E808|nr:MULTISPECIES: hypothetical protein [Pseudomonas]MDW3713406.1 hypothetical protein [Pseudomonas sp. 2023EL-01195]PZE10674.1 hypothetical protein DMX10_24790 [Pseudomonas sp. 57B-090624]